jgi:hypothetical protein
MEQKQPLQLIQEDPNGQELQEGPGLVRVYPNFDTITLS